MKSIYNKLRRKLLRGHNDVSSRALNDEKCCDTAPLSVTTRLIPPPASLEGLPIELQLEILESLYDFSSLRALVHGSPSFHYVYISERHSILTVILTRDLGKDVLFDASVVLNAQELDRASKEIEQQTRQLLEQSWEQRPSFDVDVVKQYPPDRITRLAQLHGTVLYTTEDFCKWALSKQPVIGESLASNEPLSPNETQRIRRALYRLESFCLLFDDSCTYSDSGFQCMDQTHLFLRFFEPWQVEEIACIRDYLISRYEDIWKSHEEALVRFCAQELEPWDSPYDYCRFEHDDYRLGLYKERCMFRGLQYFWQISLASDQEQLRMLLDNLDENDMSLTNVLQGNPYEYNLRTDVYDRWIAREEQHFVSDYHGPNAAWCWSNGNRLEIDYFEGREDLREWGYVMWDKERLDRWGVLDQDMNSTYVQCTIEQSGYKAKTSKSPRSGA